jgi:hypothetical protein
MSKGIAIPKIKLIWNSSKNRLGGGFYLTNKKDSANS